MIRSLAILHRRPDVTPSAFLRYWKDVHGGVVVHVPGLLHFRQNTVLANELGGVEPFVVGELVFPSGTSPVEAFESDAGRAAYASGANVIDQPKNRRIALEQMDPTGGEPTEGITLPAIRALRFSRPAVGVTLSEAASIWHARTQERRGNGTLQPIALYAVVDHNMPDFEESLVEEYVFDSFTAALLGLDSDEVAQHERSTSSGIDRRGRRDLIIETYAAFQGLRPGVNSAK